MVFYNGRYFLPATSPLLPELLEYLNTTNLRLLVVGFYNPSRATTPAFPNSILLTRQWPQHIVPATTIFFFDEIGSQFLSINDVYITSDNRLGQPCI